MKLVAASVAGALVFSASAGIIVGHRGPTRCARMITI
jgi:hypothetical protein